MKRLALLSLLLILTACDAVAPAPASVTPTPHAIGVVEAEATRQFANTQANVVQANQDYINAQNALRVTATAQAVAAATLSAQQSEDRATKQAVQATIDANDIAQAQARVDAARFQVTKSAADAQLQILEVVSKTQAVSITIALSQMDYGKQAAQYSPYRQTVDDLLYLITHTCFPLVLLATLMAILWRLGKTLIRWGERQIETPDGKRWILPPDSKPFLLAAPAPSDEDIIDGNPSGNASETQDAGTQNTPPNTTEHSVPSADTLIQRGNVTPFVRMTSEDRAEMLTVRHEAIGLLQKCLDYYSKARNEDGSRVFDDGTIPHYKKIRAEGIEIDSDWRGKVAHTLEYNGLVSIQKNTRTFVVPMKDGYLLGTCKALQDAIIKEQFKVYPNNYHERLQERRMAAVNALPAMQS